MSSGYTRAVSALVSTCACLASACANTRTGDEVQARSLALELDSVSVETHPIAAQAGYYATAAPGQHGALTGTDLGSSFVHRDKLWVMFGDSWWLDPLNLTSRPDDALGQLALSDFPDGASVDAFVKAHPAPSGEPAWRAAGPTMHTFLQSPSGGGSRFEPVRFTRDGLQLNSGVGFVPIAAFSNGRDDAAEGAFAIFAGSEHVQCQDGVCDFGHHCDLDLGTSTLEYGNPPCVIGETDGCVRGPGYCQDRGSSVYDASTTGGRTHSTVLRYDVAVTTAADPTHFKGQPWVTQRFMNSTARTVSDFDPMHAHGADNDYTPAQGNAP
jgi:hypothetical protein